MTRGMARDGQGGQLMTILSCSVLSVKSVQKAKMNPTWAGINNFEHSHSIRMYDHRRGKVQRLNMKSLANMALLEATESHSNRMGIN